MSKMNHGTDDPSEPMDRGSHARRPEFQPTLWWTPDRCVHTTDDFLRVLPHKSPEAAAQVRVLYAIGANRFQEHTMFLELFPNLEQIYLFEPIPQLVEHLTRLTSGLDYVRVFPYAVADFDGVTDFHVTNNLESSSLLQLEKHKEIYPWVHEVQTIKVTCRRLDTIIREHSLRVPDLLFIDVQGAEYKIISSLPEDILCAVKLIYTEASTAEFYKGARNLRDLQDILRDKFYFMGFSGQDNHVRNHGNALFLNKSMVHALPDAPGVKQNGSRGPQGESSPDSPESDYPDYSFDETVIMDFWRAQQRRLARYLERCSIEDNGYLPSKYRVSVLVTSYNSEEFIEECLADLVGQSTFAAEEIIFVDACSPQGERQIVRRFQEKYGNIRYVRTPERIGIYEAWNLAAHLAVGEYLTTFSTNDRLRREAHELMADALDKHENVTMVYGDTYITATPHESFYRFTPTEREPKTFKWPPYEFRHLLRHSMIGPHPMWRRRVHEQIGYWDERFQALGDQDFFLRVGERYRLLHLDIYTGLYWLTDGAVSVRGWTPWLEDLLLRMRYFHRFKLRTGRSPCFHASPDAASECEKLYRSGMEYLAAGKLQEAQFDFSRTLKMNPDHARALAGLGRIFIAVKDAEKALQLCLHAVIRDPTNIELLSVLAFCGRQLGQCRHVIPFLKESFKIRANPAVEHLIRSLDQVTQ